MFQHKTSLLTFFCLQLILFYPFLPFRILLNFCCPFYPLGPLLVLSGALMSFTKLIINKSVLLLIMNNVEPVKQEDEDKIIEDGFSSEEELQHEQLVIGDIKEEEPDHHHKEEVEFKIPPPQEIKDKTYSLRPDIETGWNSKKDLPQPIPIIYENHRFDNLVKKALKHPKNRAKIVYLGPRYENSYYAWYDKNFAFPYSHIKAPNDMKFTNRPFCGQHWQAEDELIFDSFFEGGNLDAVFRVGERQYDCFMRVDSNTAGHLQWFDFRVTGWKKLLKYKLNICNFQKDKCLFSRGMKPYLHSRQRQAKQKVGWIQSGDNIRFEKKHLAAARVHEVEMRSMYRLSIQYYTQYQNDQVEIAYCIPYTYSRLSQFLQGLASKPETRQFLKITKLCNSLGGLEVPLLNIHQGLEQNSQEEEGVPTRCIVISGRAHPGESNGSHMIQGFIEWLCGPSKEAAVLRKFIVFKIVPMLNPDGVALGNYRTGLSGKDFNREYRNPDKSMFPQVYHFKKLVSESKQLFGDRLSMFLDFHGHSTKKNTFVYGPEFPIIDKFYYQARIFPKLIGNATPMFRYYSCIFKINEFKNSTARAILLRKLGIPLSYTIQTSNGAYFDYQALKDVPFTIDSWKEMGRCISQALYEYVDLLLTADRSRHEKKLARKKDSKKDKDKEKEKKKAKTGKEKANIFSAMENEKIRHLFEEIKEAEANRDQDRASDDGLSEGSSDGEGDEDDLSSAQIQYLMQVIKGDVRSVSRCKARSYSRCDSNRPSSRKKSEEIGLQLAPEEMTLSKREELESDEVFRGRRAIHIRKPISSSKEKLFAEDKKSSNTAKIINFSFASQGERRTREERLKFYMAPRLNFVEMVAGKWNEERSRKESIHRARVVMDLSDPHFRKTYTHNLKKEEGPDCSPKVGLPSKGVMPSSQLPSKRGRFQYYKYRRLLLNNEGEGSP